MKEFIATILTAIFTAVLFMHDYRSESVQFLYLFQQWKQQFQQSYDQQQNLLRFKIFKDTLHEIETHNSNLQRTYTKGLNKFSALTKQEFINIYLGYKSDQKKSHQKGFQLKKNGGDVDWTTQGAVTNIKDQGKCGSCWAFSTTGGLQGLGKLKQGYLQSFSEQQLVDCSSNIKWGNMGCNGGSMITALKFVMAQGITTQAAYPYIAKQAFRCKIKKGEYKNTGMTQVSSCTNLQNQIQNRPISIAVDASNWSTYASGVFSDCDEEQITLNHGVLLVGTLQGNWKVKNSWGISWGQQGYIRLSGSNMCGICDSPVYPTKE